MIDFLLFFGGAILIVCFIGRICKEGDYDDYD